MLSCAGDDQNPVQTNEPSSAKKLGTRVGLFAVGRGKSSLSGDEVLIHQWHCGLESPTALRGADSNGWKHGRANWTPAPFC